MLEAAAYQPQDHAWLWWLQDPSRPRLVGRLSLVLSRRGVGLAYDPSWLAHGFALSEDLPLSPGVFIPPAKDTAAGAVDDARPDRWGERIIRKFEKSPRHSLLEFLLFAGDDRYGALGVSLDATTYRPWPTAAIPGLSSLADMEAVVRKILADEPLPEVQRRLLRPGVSLGGARPKSLLLIDDEAWLVKFSEGEDLDTELVEHATMTLAAACGVEVATTRALPVGGRHAVAICRFDRAAGRRVHAVSAHVALRAAGEAFGYPQLAQLLRRVAPAAAFRSQQAQLFRRMVFNILIDNTDDHEKNHALLRQEDGSYLLSPAFDIVPSVQGLGVQAMEVGDAGAESSLENALSQSRAFGLQPGAAREIVEQVARGIDTWHAHFTRVGVRRADLDVLAQYLEGGLLRGQREAFTRRRRSS